MHANKMFTGSDILHYNDFYHYLNKDESGEICEVLWEGATFQASQAPATFYVNNNVPVRWHYFEGKKWM